MKKTIGFLIVISFCLGLGIHSSHAEAKKDLQGTIAISGAWALYPMVVKWKEEFQKIYPLVKIDVSAGGAGKGMADALSRAADIGMVSREVSPEEAKKGAWWVSVTKDAVVPTVNEKNPVLKELLTQGVTQKNFKGIWITGELKNWEHVVQPINKQLKAEVHVYTRSDACGAAETWATFLGKNQEDLLGIGVYGDPGLAEAVQKDILGIGFNNINYAYDATTKLPIKGINVVPIDINGNSHLDGEENFYSTSDDMVKAIATGKYPSPPARNLHFVSQGIPERNEVREFISWVLTDGQRFVNEAGYINLTKEKLQEELKKLAK